MGDEVSQVGLTEARIECLVERYYLEMARYEGAARFVEQRLRRELREAAIPVLLSSRAKHPEDVRDKLRLRSCDGRYQYDALLANLNHVMTDLAGCRIVVYDPRQCEAAADVVRKTFRLSAGGRADESLDTASGYRATHLLVVLDAPDVEMPLQSAICEVQVTSISCHVFNELSHDIDYKRRGVSPGDDVHQHLREVLNAVRRLERAVEQLASARAREIAHSKRVIETPENLRFILERIVDRPVRGELEKLHRLLSNAMSPLDAHTLTSLGIPTAMARGRLAASGLHPVVASDEVDDVVALALGLLDEFGEVFRELASQWTGSPTALQRAILGRTSGAS